MFDLKLILLMELGIIDGYFYFYFYFLLSEILKNSFDINK